MTSDWDRVAADAALLADVRRRYRGSGDVADHLWWLQHPGSTAPSGAPDPELALESARRALYRQDVRADEALSTVASASRVLDDRALTRLALLDALSARESEAAERPAEPAGPARPAGRPASPRARATPARLRLLAAALTIAGLLVGIGLGRLSPPPPPAQAGPAFDRLRAPQRPIDRIATEVRPRFIAPRSTRLLAQYGAIGTLVYAARASSGDGICLIVVAFAERVAGTCTTAAAFASAGLFAVIQAAADPVDDTGRLAPDKLGVAWRIDGTLRITS